MRIEFNKKYRAEDIDRVAEKQNLFVYDAEKNVVPADPNIDFPLDIEIGDIEIVITTWPFFTEDCKLVMTFLLDDFDLWRCVYIDKEIIKEVE